MAARPNPPRSAMARRFGLILGLAVLPWAALAQEFFTLKGHGGPVKGVDAGPDGAALTASFDNSVGYWLDGVPRWLEGHEAAVNAVVFAGDGQAASAGDDFSVRLWNLGTGASAILGQHRGKVIALAAGPKGRRVASASWDGTARIWALDGSGSVEIRGHSSNVNDVAFSPDGSLILTASSDGTVRIWDAATGAARRILVRHGFGINTLVMDVAAGWLAYGATDGGTRVVSLTSGEEIADFTLDRRPILAMAYDAAGNRIAVGDGQGYIMMVDTVGWQIADDFRATLSGPVWALAFTEDSQNIHAGGLDDAMYSWPVAVLDEAARMTGTERSFLRPPEEMTNGERQFQRKCSICHALAAGPSRKAGPTLAGVFGRQAGGLDGYSYSQTLTSADFTWSDETIDQLFDLGPDHFIPGSKMPMQRITGDRDRADLIAFLREATGEGAQPAQ